MLNDESSVEEVQAIDLSSYHTFGIPVLKLLFSVALFSLAATAIYEYFL